MARIPLLLLAGAIGILSQFVTFAGSFGFVPLYAERIGASDAEVGYVTTAMLIGQLFGTMATTRIARSWGIRASLFLASGLVGASLVVVPAIASVWLLMALQGMGGMARGIVNTLLISLSLRAVAPEDRATGMGIYQAIYAAGMLAGPVASGVPGAGVVPGRGVLPAGGGFPSPRGCSGCCRRSRGAPVEGRSFE